MKKYIVQIFTAVALIAVLYSCSEDFLNAPPQAALDEGTLANEGGVEAALVSAYSMLDGWNAQWGQFSSPWPTSGSNWVWGSVTSDDAYKGSEPGDQGSIQEIELFQWLPGNPYFNDKFKALYEGVSRSNATFKLINNVKDLDANVKTRVEGEAQFLRAHYHFDAYKIWGNIPYYTEEDTDFRKANSQDPLPMIIEDFEAAVSKLPVDQAEIGRATKGAAQAYLAKAQMYGGDYASAKTNLQAVVNSGKYALSPCFHDMFTTAGENGSEMVFSIQASVNDGTTEGQNGNFADRLNFPHGGSPFGCCGFHQPSQNLVNAHKVDANGLPMPDFNDSDVAADTPVDPRLDWTVGRDDVPYLNWGIHAPDWIRSREWAGPFSPKKFSHTSGEESAVGWASAQLSPLNIPIIRYSDVLLMLAECEVETNGDLERARELVNMVRSRAANCAQGPDGGSVAIDDPGITWATYAVGTYEDAWNDQAAARAAVRMERRLELALEGHRFFDLRRWGVAQQVINDYVGVEQTRRSYMTAAAAYEDRHNLFPLPSVQIELSKVNGEAQLQQNPGW